MDLELLNFKYLGGLIRVDQSYNPGSWDNYAMDPDLYYAVVINDKNEIESIRISMQLGEKLKKIAPNAKAIAAAKAIWAKQDEIKIAENIAKVAKINQELRLKKAILQTKVQVLKGKHKGFTGIAKWLGETSYGEALLIIDDAGNKRYTKPSNVKQVA